MNEKFKNMIWKNGKEYVYTDDFIDYLKDSIVVKHKTINSISKLLGNMFNNYKKNSR